MDDEFKARRGLVPWCVGEYNWVMQVFMLRRKNLKGNLPLPEEYMYLKDEIANMSGAELYNLNSMLLVSQIFHERYPEELEYNAHFFRFHEIKDFLHEHSEELFELGLNTGPGDIMNVSPKLLESLCVLPFSLEETDEEGEPHFTFLFDEVVAAAGVKKARLAMKKESPDDLAHKGMIPWSTKEFYWAFAEQRKSKLGSISNFDDVKALGEIFRKRYPDGLTFKAHMFRFHMIKMFLFENAVQLMKDGFGAVEGEAGFRNELMDVLCTLPYSLEETDRNGEMDYTFLYSQVKNEALKKINAHLN
jgi:hypothetical protein